MRTLEEIEACEKTMLSPADVAPYLGCHPYTITLTARQNPGLLGFPVCVMGSRTRIPRDGFVRWAKCLRVRKPKAQNPPAAEAEA